MIYIYINILKKNIMKYYHDKTACFYKSFKNDLPHAYIYIYIYMYI